MILIVALLLALFHHPLKREHGVLKLSLRQNGFRLRDHRANGAHVAPFTDEVNFEGLETLAGSLGEPNLFFFFKIEGLLGYFIQIFRRVYFAILELV